MKLIGQVFVFMVFAGYPAQALDWFNHGLAPLQIISPPTMGPSAKACKSCHAREFDEWSKSQHSVAASNEIFVEGFNNEPLPRCLFCHNPSENKVSEGVNCVTCHVRNGKIYSSDKAGNSYHPFFRDPRLGESPFCAGCHQFDFNETINGQMRVTSTPVQNTYNEWIKYKNTGGLETCQGCHMPSGKHLFWGPHDKEFLSDSIALKASRTGAQVKFSIESQRVGHNVPSGDLFRHLTLEISDDNGAHFKTGLVIGRKFEMRVDEGTGDFHQVLTEDTSLKPGRPVFFSIESDKPLQFLLRYHFTSEKDEKRSRLPISKTIVTLKSGRI